MEKNKPPVGLKKKDIILKKKVVKNPPEKFFHDAAKLWIKIYGELIPPSDGKVADPDFWNDGVQKRNLKLILASLRRRAEEAKVEWSQENCLSRLEAFLKKAKEDVFVGSNFMLHVINSHKVKIFNNQITTKNGNKNQQGYSGRGSNLEGPKPTIKSKGGFGRL